MPRWRSAVSLTAGAASWSCAAAGALPVLGLRARVMPVARALHQLVSLRRTPAPRRVLDGGGGGMQQRIDDRPRRFYLVLARKMRGVADERGADQHLVGIHVVALLLRHEQLDVFAGHHRAGLLGVGAERDCNIGADTDTQVIRLLRPE